MAAVIIWNNDTVLSDYVEPGARVATTEPDRATRHVILQAASENAALGYIANGATLPTHGGMFCVSAKVTRTFICGLIYGVDFEYAGVWDVIGSDADGGKRDLRIQPTLEGWDSGVEVRIALASTQAAAEALCPVGSATPEFDHMFYFSSTAEPVVVGHCYKVTAQVKGFCWDKPIKWMPRGYAEKQSQKLAVYPGQAIPVPVESNQALVGVTALWASPGSVPDCSLEGTNATPGETFGVPDNIWSAIPNPIHVYPFGWVLETREPQIIPGTSTCLVKDQFVYYQHFKPGGE